MRRSIVTGIFQSRARKIAFILLLCSFSVLTSAFIFEYFLDFPVCILCIYQRLPWLFVVLLSAIVVFFPIRENIGKALLSLCLIALFVGVGISFYHTGVEKYWWASPGACSVTEAAPITSVQDLMAALETAPPPAPRCDDTIYLIPSLGLTLAQVNMLVSIAVAFGLLWTLFRLNTTQRENPF